MADTEHLMTLEQAIVDLRNSINALEGALRSRWPVKTAAQVPLSSDSVLRYCKIKGCWGLYVDSGGSAVPLGSAPVATCLAAVPLFPELVRVIEQSKVELLLAVQDATKHTDALAFELLEKE